MICPYDFFAAAPTQICMFDASTLDLLPLRHLPRQLRNVTREAEQRNKSDALFCSSSSSSSSSSSGERSLFSWKEGTLHFSLFRALFENVWN